MEKSHKTCMEQAKIIDTFGTYQRAIVQLVPLMTNPGSHLVILEPSVEEIFNIFFLEFFGHFNPSENLKNKNSRKTGTGNWVH